MAYDYEQSLLFSGSNTTQSPPHRVIPASKLYPSSLSISENDPDPTLDAARRFGKPGSTPFQASSGLPPSLSRRSPPARQPRRAASTMALNQSWNSDHSTEYVADSSGYLDLPIRNVESPPPRTLEQQRSVPPTRCQQAEPSGGADSSKDGSRGLRSILPWKRSGSTETSRLRPSKSTVDIRASSSPVTSARDGGKARSSTLDKTTSNSSAMPRDRTLSHAPHPTSQQAASASQNDTAPYPGHATPGAGHRQRTASTPSGMSSPGSHAAHRQLTAPLPPRSSRAPATKSYTSPNDYSFSSSYGRSGSDTHHQATRSPTQTYREHASPPRHISPAWPSVPQALQLTFGDQGYHRSGSFMPSPPVLPLVIEVPVPYPVPVYVPVSSNPVIHWPYGSPGPTRPSGFLPLGLTARSIPWVGDAFFSSSHDGGVSSLSLAQFFNTPVGGMVLRDEDVPVRGINNHRIFFEWPGYPAMSPEKLNPALSSTSSRFSITHGELAKTLARMIMAYLSSLSASPESKMPSSGWSIELYRPEDIQLLGLALIQGKYRPVLKV